MHELALAESLVGQIEEICSREGGTKVKAVRLEIGGLSGVDIQAFEFAFPFAAEGTRAENAELEIEAIPAKVRCGDCIKESETEFNFLLCPECGSDRTEIICGKEFILKSLLIE